MKKLTLTTAANLYGNRLNKQRLSNLEKIYKATAFVEGMDVAFRIITENHTPDQYPELKAELAALIKSINKVFYDQI